MTRSIDTWIIESIFEPISYRMEAWTGVNNFALSRFSMTGWLAAAGVNAIQQQANVYYIGLSVTIFGCVLGAWNASQCERMSKRFTGTAPFNCYPLPFRYLWLGFCAGAAATSVLTLNNWHNLLGDISYAAHMYFLCCSPMPPNYKQELGMRSVKPAMETVT